MADIEFTNTKGMLAYYATLPAANDALILVPIQTTGLEADATLRDYDDLAALLAGTSNEHAMGRKTIIAGGITITVDDTANTKTIDIADQTYVAPAAGVQVGAFLLCYDPDTTAGTDSTIIPLTKQDAAVTPDGVNDIDVRWPSNLISW
jgi:hypothetical protein